MKLLVLNSLFGALSALAAPAPQAGPTSDVCVGTTQYKLGDGQPEPVPTGTECQMVNGVRTFVTIGSTQNNVPAAPNPTASTSSSSVSGGAAASAVNTGTSATTVVPPAVAPVVSPSVVGAPVIPVAGGGDPAGPQIAIKVPLTHLVGTATCQPGAPKVTATKPATSSKGTRFVAYWSVTHGTGKGILPSKSQLIGVTHLILAFWDPRTMNTFQASSNTDWDTTTAAKLRALNPGMKVMVAVGGWDSDEFFRFNATDDNRDHLAENFAEFVLAYNLDGLDSDWEYPVNNGASYQGTRPNSPCDRTNNVLLLQSIRQKLEALKSDSNPIKEYTLSLAVPALDGDMAAYDTEANTEINKVVDFWNIMSYDAVNRRSVKTGHHGGYSVIETAVNNYKTRGVDPKDMNIGFAMYAKGFHVGDAKDPATGQPSCSAAKPLGCPMDPKTMEMAKGTEIVGTSGAVVFNAELNSAKDLGTDNYDAYTKSPGIFPAWDKVKSAGVTDSVAMATSAFDEASGNFYTWLTAKDTADSCAAGLKNLGVGGIMAWSIDQDDAGADGGTHFKALQGCLSSGSGAGA